MNAVDKIEKRIRSCHTLLCIGLDPDISLMPRQYVHTRQPLFSFCRIVVEKTHEYTAAFKPNSAFFERYGAAGIMQLKKICDYLKNKYPDIPLILDAKRADISSTNLGYTGFIFDYLGADAVTLHPYLGSEALKPFLERKDQASIILCRTSNPGAGELQDLSVVYKNKKIPLYEAVARQIVNKWNTNGNCMLVVGATFPKELAIVRKIVGDMYILVPGVGTQGGEVGSVVKTGLNSKKRGLLINVGRAILYAGGGKEISLAAKKYRDLINSYIN